MTKNTSFFSKPLAIVLFTYGLILHAIIFSLIARPDLAYRLAVKLQLNPPNDFVTLYKASMNTMHARVDKNTPENALIFIGDSLVQGLSVTAIHPRAVNFGIGHDTVRGVAKRSLTYQSLMSSSSVVISIGINDLRNRTLKATIADYKLMIEQLAHIPSIYIHEVLPVDSNLMGIELQHRIIQFNNALFQLTKDFDNITLLKYSPKFTDFNGNLKPYLHLGDGLHLNENGSRIWIQQLKQQLDTQ